MEVKTHEEYSRSLLESGLFSDCTITCQGRVWHTHRAIIVPRSEFLRACFTSGFKESVPQSFVSDVTRSQESMLRSVSLDDDEPDAVGRLLVWLYTLTYPAQGGLSDGERLPSKFFTSELNLILLADKYGAVGLVRECVESMLDGARSISDIGVPDQCEAFVSCMSDLAEMLEVLFTSEAVSCVSAIAGFDLRMEILEHISSMIAKHISQTVVLESLLEIPGFGVMLVEVLGGVTAGPVHIAQDDGNKRRGGLRGSVSRNSSFEVIIRSSRRAASGLDSRRTSQGSEPPQKTLHIPMNEDSDVE